MMEPEVYPISEVNKKRLERAYFELRDAFDIVSMVLMRIPIQEPRPRDILNKSCGEAWTSIVELGSNFEFLGVNVRD